MLPTGNWSSGMIPASGAGGREFDSRIAPVFFLIGFFFLFGLPSGNAKGAVHNPN
jgi:hypothetical protein